MGYAGFYVGEPGDKDPRGLTVESGPDPVALAEDVHRAL